MKNILLLLTFLTVSLLADNKKIVLQLNWLNQFQFAGYYIAKEKGFYDKVGLDVEIKEFTSNTNLIESIKTKKADFAIGRSSLLIERSNGEDVVALGAIFQESPLFLLVKKDLNINSVLGLKNKKIMITPDAAFSASLLAMLSANGLKKDDYIIQKHSFDINDLINGNTDAMASYLSNEPIILNDRGIEYKEFRPKDFGFDFYSDILFTSSEYIKNNQKVTKDFYDASVRGWNYAFNNKAEAAELIFKKYNTQNKSYIHLVKEGEILEKLAYANGEALGNLDSKKLKNIYNVFKLFGLTNKDMDINAFIYSNNPKHTMSVEISYQNQKLIFMFFACSITIFLVVLYLLSKNKQLKDQLSTVIDASDDFIYYKDNNLTYLGCNKVFERYVGKKKSEIIGKTDFELFPRDYALKLRNKDMEALNLNVIYEEDEWVTYDNKEILLQIKKIPFIYKKNKKKGVLTVGRDITKLYEIQEKLKNEAYHDALTNIYNRKAFNERIEEKFDLYNRYESRFCIAMYDIDDFKFINDNYGHDAGDRVLVEMTKEIKSKIRKTDLIFRVGGEEFVIIFSKTLINEAFTVVEKIRETVSKMRIIDNRSITISIGITEVKEADTPTTIYERIDKLMYVSKHEGKNKTSRD